MHRSRTVIALFVALLCLALAVPILHGREKNPAAPEGPMVGGKEKDPGKPGDDEVIVKPKGSPPLLPGGGYKWTDKYEQVLAAEDGKQFRCSIFEKVKALQAGQDKDHLSDVFAVEFSNSKLKFWVEGVERVDSKFEWKFPIGYEPPVSCNKGEKKCKEGGGVPPDFMDDDGEGKLSAQDKKGSAWKDVKWVRIIGGKCD